MNTLMGFNFVALAVAFAVVLCICAEEAKELRSHKVLYISFYPAVFAFNRVLGNFSVECICFRVAHYWLTGWLI